MINKIKLIREIRSKLNDKKISIGTWQQISNSSISEILGKAGYDWVVVDLEHGSISIDVLPDLCRAIELGNTLPMVRVAEANSKDCKQALDAGAAGIVLPMINYAEDLQKAISYCCWPPNGERGVGYSRANLFGKEFEKYNEEAQAPLIFAQIENIIGVNNLDKILQVHGLDGIIIGPYDLSASMGITGKFEESDYIKTEKKIKKISAKHNIPRGYHIVFPELELLKQKIDEGYLLLAYATDGMFLNTIGKNPIK